MDQDESGVILSEIGVWPDQNYSIISLLLRVLRKVCINEKIMYTL